MPVPSISKDTKTTSIDVILMHLLITFNGYFSLGHCFEHYSDINTLAAQKHFVLIVSSLVGKMSF